MKITIYGASGQPLHTWSGSAEKIKRYYYSMIEIMQANNHSFIITAGAAELLHDCNYNLFVRYDNKAKQYKRIGNALNFIEKMEDK